jgi:hypothetical protein
LLQSCLDLLPSFSPTPKFHIYFFLFLSQSIPFYRYFFFSKLFISNYYFLYLS